MSVTNSCNSHHPRQLLAEALCAEELDALDLALDARVAMLDGLIESDTAPGAAFWREQRRATISARTIVQGAMFVEA